MNHLFPRQFMWRVLFPLILSISIVWSDGWIRPCNAQSLATSNNNLKEINDLYLNGQNLLLNGDYVSAVEVFAKLSDLCKDESEIQNSRPFQANYGLALLKVGRTDEAITHLLKATSSPLANAETWENLANGYMDKGLTAEARQAFEKALSLNPSEGQAQRLQYFIQLTTKEIADKQSSSTQGTDYFDDATKESFIRWNQMPIKVYIQPYYNSPYFKTAYISIAKQAFTDWANASDKLIKVEFVDNKEAADIELVWTTNGKDLRHSGEGGDFRYISGANGLVKGIITILIHLGVNTGDSANILDIKTDALTNIIYHEVGHSLGLCGHSHSRNDIMYYYCPQFCKPVHISERDKNTIVRLYTEPYRINACTLNAQGITFAKAGNEAEAIPKFEEALKLSTSSETSAPIIENLIRARYSIALKLLKQQNFDKAEVQLDKLLEVAEQQHYSKLLQLVETNMNLLNSMGKKNKATQLRQKYPNAN